MQEIGGYFELEHFSGREYHPDAIAFNTANNALLWLLEQKRIHRIWIPNYLCDSVYASVKRKKDCEICCYKIDENLQPQLFAEPIDPQDTVYLVNYYGQLSMQLVEEIRKSLPNLILDNVQAFFEKPLSKIDTLYSCRKWFGVPDGAYLYTENFNSSDLPADHSAGRFTHLLGRFETTASDWYASYRKNEEELEKSPIRKMSALSHNPLRGLNYSRIAQQRDVNFSFFHRLLQPYNRLPLKVPYGAFMYPLWLRTEEPQVVRREMAKRKIYIPTLWPNLRDDAKMLSDKILPLPVDQRYGESDLKRVVECLEEICEIKILAQQDSAR